MKGRAKHIVCISAAVAVILLSFRKDSQEQLQFHRPQGWPKPVYNFRKNKVTTAGFILGRTLFNDPLLSKDNSTSCASCHLNFTAFTHADHNLSHGIYGLKGTRNSLALFNLAWNTSFMWDGGVTSLEQQPINPITNHVEMDNSMEVVLTRLNNSPKYRRLFYAAYNDSSISTSTVLKSLAQFTAMLESYNSRYDSVQRGEPGVVFTESEQRGLAIFRNHCAQCHAEPLFTDYSFRNNGLPVDTALNDWGRMKITGDRGDSLKFRVPSLRNIAVSAPYMHDGRFPRLKDVLEHYSNGINHTPTLAPELREKIGLSAQDKRDLLAFLNTLTDKVFLYDVKFREPVPQ